MSLNKNFTVLLVEDEPADAHLARMAFEEGRVLVDLHQVTDGVEALDFLLQQGAYKDCPRPDLILLDLNMPRMNGRQFLKEVKQLDAFKGIPVVVLTTSDAETDIVSSYDLGAAGFIVKPVNVLDFIKQIQQLEDYWVMLVRHPVR